MEALPMMKPITLKVQQKLLKLLNEVSKATHIPKSALIRKGIELVILQSKNDVMSLEVRNEIDKVLHEDRELLKRLA
jgi:hypothetical protein